MTLDCIVLLTRFPQVIQLGCLDSTRSVSVDMDLLAGNKSLLRVDLADLQHSYSK